MGPACMAGHRLLGIKDSTAFRRALESVANSANRVNVAEPCVACSAVTERDLRDMSKNLEVKRCN